MSRHDRTQDTETAPYGLENKNGMTQVVYQRNYYSYPGATSPAFGNLWWQIRFEFRLVLLIIAWIIRTPFVFLKAILWASRFTLSLGRKKATPTGGEKNTEKR